ncbi:MAG TPA: riboflavin biosynthesis protein RibF [Marinilabiliales bacterium]|nr:riboflavin biosynthesis protein RibF [Marinilabiliales bacterium]HBX84753.1 riboflavin biosynthesis protein RibF [Marinilabiliales bacterium]HBY52302.1 riboflavin biosynthesis protein RibF [Marinilabiliales bacterium]HCC29877.1 riboflavin biosynthesis protein RibF [Marinilabiliales bacterium]
MTVLKIWEDISGFDAIRPVVTIGSFDGVHLGHQQVIKQLNQLASEVNGESVIFTFSPHPSHVLAPHKKVVLLTTIEEKISLFQKADIKHLVLYPFSKELAQLSYREFVSQILVDKLNLHTLLVGYDHSFGKNREGNFEQLSSLAPELGFRLVRQDEVTSEGATISSTLIRNLLANGKLLDASKLLGYPYLLSGTVVHGQQLGNKLGFPTANLLAPDNKLVPGNGVYAVLVEYNGTRYQGMMNIGLRPTIDDTTHVPVIEAHLFDFGGSLYGKFIKIHIIRKLRDEYKFETVDALRVQLKKDKAFALETLAKECPLDK